MQMLLCPLLHILMDKAGKDAFARVRSLLWEACDFSKHLGRQRGHLSSAGHDRFHSVRLLLQRHTFSLKRALALGVLTDHPLAAPSSDFIKTR